MDGKERDGKERDGKERDGIRWDWTGYGMGYGMGWDGNNGARVMGWE
jgi:hypothetical protein